MRAQIVQSIELEKIIAIIRLTGQANTGPVVDNLVKGGIKILEITSNTPGFCNEIQKTRKKYPGILIGAGTITNTELAKEAVSCGAQFLVTPNTCPQVVPIAHQADIPVLMGAATPTEVALAVEHHADFIKLFPAGALGLDYFKALLGPFNNVKFLAVGGINLSNAASWFQAGVAGVGIGGSLTKADAADVQAMIKDLFQSINK